MSLLLTYFAQTNATFLHADGERSTDFLIDSLALENEIKILEIGCGMGSTLIKIANKNKSIKLFGVDSIEKMISKSSKRLKYTNTKLIVSKNNKLPFNEETFDRIYAESVFAIQERANLDLLLQEAVQKLKPKGFLVINETIWLSNTDISIINRINKQSKDSFGIIQSNQKHPYLSDWINMFKKNNLDIIHITPTSEIPKTTRISIKNNIFKLKGKINLLASSKLRSQKKEFSRIAKEIIPDNNKQLMQGYIIKAQKH